MVFVSHIVIACNAVGVDVIQFCYPLFVYYAKAAIKNVYVYLVYCKCHHHQPHFYFKKANRNHNITFTVVFCCLGAVRTVDYY